MCKPLSVLQYTPAALLLSINVVWPDHREGKEGTSEPALELAQESGSPV